MTAGYKVNGTDLDSIFAPYYSGWPEAAVTGYKVNGADLNGRYAKLSSGSAAATTGYKVNGTDLNAIFAAYGSTSVQVETQPGNVAGSAAAGNPSGTVTSNTTTCAGEKGAGAYTYTCHIASGSATPTAPNSATSGVTNSAVPAGTTITGTMYWTISDGVTSVNTNEVDWSLHNTSSAFLYSGTITTSTVETDAGGSGQIISYGYGSGWDGDTPFGALSPTADTNGHAIAYVYGVLVGLTPDQSRGFVLGIESSSSLGQSYFTTLTITVSGTEYQLSSADAAYSYSGGASQWSWSGETYIAGSGLTVPMTYI